MKKKFTAILLSIIIAFSLGFSQSVAKAAYAGPVGWTYISSTWYYLDTNGTKMTNKWTQDSSKRWFYLGADGAMAVNKWAQDGSKKWFYLGADGAMKTNGWITDSGKWYYLNADGSRGSNQWALNSSNKLVYVGEAGTVRTSCWIWHSNNWYYLNSDGTKAINKWAQDGSKKWFYLGPEGTMKTSSWVLDGGKWYYLNSDGSMATNTKTPDGFYVDINGVWDGKGSSTGVKDTTPPIITLNGSSATIVYMGSTYADAGAFVNDNIDSILTATMVITNSSGAVVTKVDTTKTGAYKITYSAVDSSGNKAATVVRTITVEDKIAVADTIAPVITLKGNPTQYVAIGKVYTDAGATVTDNKDTNLTASVKITNSSGTVVSKIDTTREGTYKITYNASDSAGNTATAVIRKVIVEEDKTPPVITLKGYETQYVKNGLIYADAGVTVTDDADTNLTAEKTITNLRGRTISKIDTTVAGEYTITYTAEDTSGNEADEVVRTVIVKDEDAPVSFAIDIGHNCAYDGGATGIRREDDCTLEVGTLVKEELEELEYDVVDCSPTNPVNTTDALKQRVDLANAAAADYLVSIHFNASGYGNGYGSEVYYFSGSDVGNILASNVQAELVSLGYFNRGVKTAGFYVIRNSDMPAILIECSFVDSSTDMAMYNAEDIASAIVRGLTKLP
ncbi:MAG: immunoglobulin-like domain-containing protein [Clostridiaceae bacterium]